MKIPVISRLAEIWQKRNFEIDNIDHVDRYLRGRGISTYSGIAVTPENALTSTAVYACVRVLSYSLAQLPLVTYRRLARGKERAADHPAYHLLHTQPNPELTSFQWRATAQAHILLYGDSYAEIEFDRRGDPVALWMLPAWRTTPRRKNDKRRQLFYLVSLPDGQEKPLPAERVLHFKGLSIDGTTGLSIIRQAANSIGVSLAAQEFAGRFFGQGLNTGGVAQHPGKLSEVAYERLKSSLEESNAGLGKAHRIMLLEEGLKFEKLGIPPEEAQFLESRQFQVVDIARIFGVPPHKIGDLSRATFSNIEHQAIEFVQDTMMPWLVNWEQEINRKLFHESDYFAEFLIEGLLRGDSQSRAAFYKDMFQMAALSPNDIREKENMNPVEHGDSYFVPMNLMPVTMEEIEAPPIEQVNRPEQRKLTLTRHRVAQSYRPVFEAAGKRIVDREVKNLRKQMKAQLGERSVTLFREWLEDFYRDFPEYIVREIKPAAYAMAAAIVPLASDEVGQAPPNLDQYVNEYAAQYANQHVKSSKGQLLSLLALEDYEDEMEERFGEWQETRPGKIGMQEAIHVSNGVAKYVFGAAGIIALIWVNTSGKSCPYCEELNGRKVGIDQPFLAYGAELESEDGKMAIYRPTLQPPLHEGCQCQIEPA